MGWFNYYGLAIMTVIMVPNIVYIVYHKNDPANVYPNKTMVYCEQAGRYGCFAFMIFNIPYTYFNFWFDHALTVHLSVNGGLCLAYVIFWIVCRKRKDKLKALSLSILPSLVFLFCGIVLANIPLAAFAVIFAVTHITISYKTVGFKSRKKYTVEDKIKDEAILILVLVILVCAVISFFFGSWKLKI